MGLIPIWATGCRQTALCMEEASRSVEPSGHRTYVMSPCHTDYRSRYVEQFREMHTSAPDPVSHPRCHLGKGNKWACLNVAYYN
eukprot:5439212-Ditylum_brightwellii.AAC.1